MPSEIEQPSANAALAPDQVTPQLPAETGRALVPASPRLRIELDRQLRGGFLHGRHDLWVRGRVIADAPVERVSLRAGHHTLGTLAFGRTDGSATTADSDGSTRAQYGFMFSLSRMAAEAASPYEFVISAAGEEAGTSESFVVVPGRDGDSAAGLVIEGPTSADAGDAGVLAPAILYVERATIHPDGQVTLQGWALSLAPVVTIQIFANDTRIGVAQLARSREDVARAYPAYPNAAKSGFVFATRLGDGWQRISHLRVEVVSLSGTTHEAIRAVEIEDAVEATPEPVAVPAPATGAAATAAPPAEARDPRRRIHMFNDMAALSDDGRLLVSGWAVSAVGIARVEVRLDGEAVGNAELALPRADVADAHPSIPMARYSGFHFARQLPGPLSGTHELSVTAVNGLDDVRRETERVEAVPAKDAAAQVAAAAPAGSRTAFRLEVDMPEVIGGAVAHPVAGMLTIQGWALAPSQILNVAVFLDGVRKGDAHYGLSRPDVADAHKDRQDALRSGFVFLCPLRGLETGAHSIRIVATAAGGQTALLEFRINVHKDANATGYADLRRRLPPLQVALYAELLGRAAQRPGFCLVLRLDRSAGAVAVAATLHTLVSQVCQDWRLLVLAEDDSAAALLRALLSDRFAAIADRVAFATGGRSSSLAAALRDGNPADRPLRYGFLCPGDELGCDALAEVALFAVRHPDAALIYADEARISPVTGAREAFFKPDWSPDLLLSTNYIGRPWFVTADVLENSKATPAMLAREGEYGLLLRCTEQTTGIRRLAKLLCLRGSESLDAASRERAALKAAVTRRGLQAEVLPGCTGGIWRLRRRVAEIPLVSIVIPTRGAHDHVKACIETLRSRTKYRRFEIICIDNVPDDRPEMKSWLHENADVLVNIPGQFNWSRFNNLAAKGAQGEYLLFLNDDIEIVQDEWLDAMMEHAQRPDIGVVGPQLLYPDRKVQHAGMFLSGLGLGRHAFRMLEADDPGYFGLALTQRNVIAVTGACMLIRRDNFAALGGFDEAHEVINNDLDYCLRAHEKGQRIVFTPHARLIHHEMASRDRMEDVFDTSRFADRWRSLFAAGDPYFSPRLSLESDDYRPDDEPAQEIFVGHPVFDRAEVRRVLAVKLDHIGDFLTGLPAMRRLKELFPAAELHVLASPAVRSVAVMEPAIDGFIDFQFFHTRSELGPRDLTEEDFRALEERLTPYGFDLAVDLRMHPDTRAVMRHVPARLRAGYDHAGQFPFLDIVLEWDKDSPLQRKRAHVSDRLLNLVEAVATASNPVRMNGSLRVGDPAEALGRLPAKARRLFRNAVAAVHPGVGNSARQWPAEHYASLCDLLVEKSGLNVVLIGGPDERELAEQVLAQVSHPEAVMSLAGQTALADLPLLLKACVLYVGNNSGPKHVAASVGVPTLGLHSGVVDAVEWGPLGERAMALQRNMLCKPCYLLKAEDCPRELACLRQLTPAVVHQSCETLLGLQPPRPGGQDRRRVAQGKRRRA